MEFAFCYLQEYEKTKQEPEEIVPEASENKVPEAKNSEVKHAEAQKETLIKKEEAPPPISREEPVDFLVCISLSGDIKQKFMIVGSRLFPIS